MAPATRSQTAKRKSYIEGKTSQQLQENLEKTFSEIDKEQKEQDEDDSLEELIEKQTEWQKQVHDALQFSLERGDELNERVETIDSNFSILQTGIKEDVDALSGRVNQLNDVITETQAANAEVLQNQLLIDKKNKEILDELEKRKLELENVQQVINIQVKDGEELKTKEELTLDWPAMRKAVEKNVSANLLISFEEKLQKATEAMEEKYLLKINELTVSQNKSVNELKKTQEALDLVLSQYNEVELENRDLKNQLEKLTTDLKNSTETNIRNYNDLQRQIHGGMRASTRAISIAPTNQGSNETTFSISAPALKIKAPTFKAEEKEKPMKFLKEMKRYVTATQLDHENMMYSLSQALQGAASDWWSMTETFVKSWKDFEKKFKQRFWSDITQDHWARKINYGRFSTAQKVSRVEYATNLWSFAQELDLNYTEKQLVEKIATHFDFEIRFAMKAQNICNQEKLFELLEMKDRDEQQRKNYRERNTNKPPNANNSNNSQNLQNSQKPQNSSQNKDAAGKPSGQAEKKNFNPQNKKNFKKAVERYDQEVNVLDLANELEDKEPRQSTSKNV